MIKAGTLLTDKLGANPRARLRVMCDEVGGYVMVRLAGYAPFVIRVSDVGKRYFVMGAA